MEEKIKELTKKIEELSDKLEFIYFDVSWMFDDPNCESAKYERERREKQAKIKEEYNRLNSQLDILYRIDFAMKNDPTLSNEILDLYVEDRDSFTQACQYNLFKHGTYEYVGNIRFYGENDSIFGNVSYEIEEQQRGNHYALIGLKLIGPDLAKRGINELFISAEKWNTASIKTIEKFNGKLISDEGGLVQYKCDIKNKKITRS